MKKTVENGGGLSRDEMVEILEGIAREGGETARIQAIKTLLALKLEGTEDAPGDDWSVIYGDGGNVAPLRRRAS